MALEILDVVDTAVKVGLGALISAWATSYVTHLNHRTDRQKAVSARRIEVLTATLSNLEGYFIAYEACCAQLAGLLRSGTAPGPLSSEELQRYGDTDDTLIKQRSQRLIAAAQLRLIGMKPTAVRIESVGLTERKLREMVLFNEVLPTQEVLDGLLSAMRLLREDIYEQMALAFERDSSLTA